jgi:glucosamine-phosphate N-acetyltransferase
MESFEIKNPPFRMRELEFKDFDKYLRLIEQLSPTVDSVSFQDYVHFVGKMSDNHEIFVLEEKQSKDLVGAITYFVEQKIIHNMGSVGHIEDVVVDEKYRGSGLGKQMIEYVWAKLSKSCYKIILDCDEKNVPFYLKCGFQEKGIQMAHYFG